MKPKKKVSVKTPAPVVDVVRAEAEDLLRRQHGQYFKRNSADQWERLVDETVAQLNESNKQSQPWV